MLEEEDNAQEIVTINYCLQDIEADLFNIEHRGEVFEYDIETFRASLKIFSSQLWRRMYLLLSSEGASESDMIASIEACSLKLKRLIKVFADIDTEKLYNLEN